ncbi:hypothetical protein DPMN_005256 [Dreissena polymorpha]|uniref:Uncharacterized protein n=1 Tax=Dreissena polymorpha TaxID=45954 RepID=A0A9D4MRT9_DREPO|nr:hypothetical protein DPMN_005256 [Dreissena polymorpha]
MHVGTALFICALPTLCKRVCSDGGKTANKKQQREILHSVKVYMGYFEGESSSEAEEELMNGEPECV